jgi:hypothetical protein
VTTNLNENESSFGVSSRRESMSALSSKVSSRRVRKHDIQAMTKHLNDFPLLSYEELDELYLPLCAASWEHVATTKADDGTNLLLEEMFQLNAFQGMRTLKNKTDAQFIESALTQQATGRNKMTTNPMSFIKSTQTQNTNTLTPTVWVPHTHTHTHTHTLTRTQTHTQPTITQHKEVVQL